MAQDKDLKTPNIPPLRFPDFTDEWKKVTLGEIGIGFNYGLNAPAKEYDGMNKYIRITDIEESTGAYSEADIVSPNGKLSDEYIVNNNDILLARTGASTGKSYLYAPKDGRLYFAGFLIRFNVNKANPYFIYTNLHTRNYWRWVNIMSARSGQPGINSQEYSSYPLYIPSRKEQNKIANLLQLLDERIATQNKIIDNLQSLIKGLAKELTKQGEPNTRISDCLECHTSTLQESNLQESGKYPVYGASGVTGHLDEYVCDKDSILIIKDGSGVGTVSHVSGKYSVIGTLNYLTAKLGYSLDYLYFCLMSFNFDPFKTGMAIPHIYFKDYGRAKIWCPSLESQNDIAKILSAIEEKLQIESGILDSLHRKKSYLLNNMFI